MHPGLFASTDIRQITLFSDPEKAWLTNIDSLTQNLRVLTQGVIKLHLFYDNWGDASADFRSALGMKADCETVWIRRIEWRYHNQIWLSCVVVIPQSSIIDGKTDELTRIGNGAIGDLLFKDPTLKRGDFVFTGFNGADKTITRHRIFTYKGQPLLVAETFLPEFFKGLEKFTVPTHTLQSKL